MIYIVKDSLNKKITHIIVFTGSGCCRNEVFEIEILSEIVYYIADACDSTLIIIMAYFYLHRFDLCASDPISYLR